MGLSQYWVGQIPDRPLAIDVRDSDGRQISLANYNEFNMLLLGSDNEKIDLTGSFLTTSGAESGRFVFRWPTDRSVFNKSGEYLLQLELKSPTARDFTTEHTIKVRRLGGKN